MHIDTLLPTYNRCGLLARALDSFLVAERPENAVVTLIVVDNNSTDATSNVVADYVAKYPDRIRYLFEPKQGKHHALNAGLECSCADVIALFDDDEVLERNWYKVVVGASKPHWLPSGYPGVLGIIHNGEQRLQYGSAGLPGMLTGGNSAIRRAVLERCGPYSADFMYAEDRYMYMQLQRLGAVGFYDPDLIVFHHVPPWRLTKTYYRHWVFTEGRIKGKVARQAPTEQRSLLGAPLWMWRRAVESACDLMLWLGRPPHRRFQLELQLIEFWGYLSARALRLADKYQDRTSFADFT